jgi:hypothetical protein
MTADLVPLDKPDKIDTKGWNIDFNQLLTPKRGTHPYIFLTDNLFESPNEKYACLFYTVVEWTMCSYGGLIGIFTNKNNPKLLVNPKNQWFDYEGVRSLIFSDDLLFVRKNAYNKNEKLSGTPFVVFDLSNKIFGFIDFDATSIYYSLIKVQGNIYRFNLDMPEEMKHITLPNRHGQTFDLTTLKFYSFDKLDNILDIYFEEKKLNTV